MSLKYLRILLVVLNIGVYFFVEMLNQIRPLSLFAVECYILVSFLILLGINIWVYRSVFHITVLFQVTFFIFYLGQPVLDLLGLRSLMEFSTHGSLILLEGTRVSSLLDVHCSLLFLSLGIAFLRCDRPDGLRQDRAFVTVGKTVFFVFLPLLAGKYFLEMQYILQHSYLDYYRGGLASLDYYSPLIKYSHVLCFAGFFGFLAGNPGEKEFNKVSLLFVVLAILDGLKGSRGAVILPIFFYLWYKDFFYKKRSLKAVLVTLTLGILLVFGAQCFAAYRMNLDFDSQTNFLVEFLFQQGKTSDLIGILKEYRMEMPPTTLGYVFEPLTFPYKYFTNHEALSMGQNAQTVAIRENLNHRITNFLDPVYYESGAGLGSSYVAEIMEYGPLQNILFSLFLAVLITSLLNNANKRIVIFMSYLMVTHIFIMSRAEYFVNLWDLIKMVGMYALFLLLVRCYRALCSISRLCFRASVSV